MDIEVLPGAGVENFSLQREQTAKSVPVVATLVSEGEVSAEDLVTRRALAAQLEILPPNALDNLQYLQPQVGCFNRCSFCSQSAGSEIWQMTGKGLANLFSAIKTVGQRRVEKESLDSGPLVGSGRLDHKPGVIFPYLDNDIGSYPYLYEYIRYLSEDLGAKIRISTVGFSRNNPGLQNIHDRIVSDLPDAFSGVRFSFTPYTYGMTEAGEVSGTSSREEYVMDMGNTLRTYKPLVEHLGAGKDLAAIELRFKPRVETGELEETEFGDYKVIKIGNDMVIFPKEVAMREPTVVIDVLAAKAKYSQEGQNGAHIILSGNTSNWQAIAEKLIAEERLPKNGEFEKIPEGQVLGRITEVHTFRNGEGIYYVTDPGFNIEGKFRTKQFYPKTEQRRVGGMIDSERYFLNALIDFKKERGLKRSDQMPDATFEDIDECISLVDEVARKRGEYDPRASEYISANVIDLVRMFRRALFLAGYKASYFFDKNFTIDTGQIVNQGRAITQFKGITQIEDMPLTPQEERGYGETSLSSRRGYVWRISPSPMYKTELHSVGKTGKKNNVQRVSGITVSMLDWHNLIPITPDGQLLPSVFIEGVELERVDLRAGESRHLFPGSKGGRPNA